MIKTMIAKIVEGKDLTLEESREAMGEIMEGRATPAQIASFITGLRMKGETSEEITGAAMLMREKVTGIKVTGETVDTCGTGGDRMNTFNISTAASLVVAGLGVKVAKHGNRSVSSRCGSADVFESLGVKLEISPAKMEECIEKVGIGFLFAPLLHGAMKFAVSPRKEIGIRTIFNLLGPLTNPAKADYQVLGVYHPDLTEKLATVLKNLGTKKGLVVHGEDGFDEISITGKTRITELKGISLNTYYISPEDFGIKRAEPETIEGGSPQVNSRIIREILRGKKGPGRDVVLLNAAAALLASEKVKNFSEGIELAKNSIDSKAALEKLEMLIEFTNS